MGHVARMGKKTAYRREESEGMRPLGRIRRKLKDNIEVDLSYEVEGGGVDTCRSSAGLLWAQQAW